MKIKNAMMKTTISKVAAGRIQKKASMPMEEFVAEHRRLVKTLRSGSKATRVKEATDQAKELKEK